MDETEGWRTIDEQRSRVADLLDTLTPAQWAAPSGCSGWTVKDVGAHLAVPTLAGPGAMVAALLRGGFRFDPMIDRLTRTWSASRSPAQVVADLRSIVGARRLAPTTTWRDPLVDVLVHGQDIARPLGLELAVPPEAAVEALRHAWRPRSIFRPETRLPGIRLVASDAEWSAGRGREVRAPTVELLLLTTGRLGGADLAAEG